MTAGDTATFTSASALFHETAYRAIDLLCLMVAPVFVGVLMTFTSNLVATLCLSVYAMVLGPQLLLLKLAARHAPALRWGTTEHPCWHAPLQAGGQQCTPQCGRLNASNQCMHTA